MYLLDTNIVLELLLDQDRADEVAAFLHRMDKSRLCVSDFSLFSVGIHLFRRGMPDVFADVLQDFFMDAGIQLARLDVGEMATVAATARSQSLDFDDAYQYACADSRGMTIVSFDADFDGTARGRSTPGEVMVTES